MGVTPSINAVEHAAARATRPQDWIRPKAVDVTPDGEWVRAIYEGPLSPARVRQDVLHRFLALRTPESVRRFVSDYGELGVNPEGQRATLIVVVEAPASLAIGPWSSEPVAIYLEYSRRMNAALRLASDRGVPGDESAIQHHVPEDRRLAGRVTKAARRQLVADFANWWLAAGRVAPRLIWPQSATVPRLEWPRGVWGALGAQLIDRLQRPMPGEADAQCANPECLKIFRYRGRKPRTDRRQWCADCRKQGVRSKLAMRARAATRVTSGA
jgi:hypothetical protein